MLQIIIKYIYLFVRMIWCDGNISSFIYTFIIEEAWSSKRDNVFPFFTHSLSMRTVVFWFPFRFVYAALCSNPKPFIIFVIALFVVSVRTKPTVFFLFRFGCHLILSLFYSITRQPKQTTSFHFLFVVLVGAVEMPEANVMGWPPCR